MAWIENSYRNRENEAFAERRLGRRIRIAFETRLKESAIEEGVDLQRVRRQVAFAPSTMPVVCHVGCSVAAQRRLRDGIAHQGCSNDTGHRLGVETASVTCGRLGSKCGNHFGNVREAAETDSQDHFTFLIGEAVQDLDAAPYGGARFPVEARFAGHTFARFHLDVGTGDVLASHTLCSPVETGWGLLASRLRRSRQFLLRNSSPKRSTPTHYREKAARTPA